MASASLSDYNGEIDVTIFPARWEELKNKLQENTIAAVKGKIRKDSYKNRMVFYIESMMNMDRLIKKSEKNILTQDAVSEEQQPSLIRDLHIRLERNAVRNVNALYTVRNILIDNPGPSSVFIHVTASQGETIIRTGNQISTAQAAQNLQECTFVSEIWEN
jgi:DNA polymerase III alpha subunit